MRVAVAQVEVSGEVPTAEVLLAAGSRVRAAMTEAAAAGARLVLLPEGTLTYPGKRAISATSPEIGDADWSKADWPALRAELEAVADHARAERIWTVVGAPHRLSDGRRPHNSLYVFDDAGALVTRYDKRRLSTTEVTHLYTPGTVAVTFDVDGVRFGFVLCLETLFPELLVDYAAMDVDCVLHASAPDAGFADLARAHAHMNAMSVALAFASDGPDGACSGITTLFGWSARLDHTRPGVAVADVPDHKARRDYHRRARTDLYDGRHAVGDPRSDDRQSL